ncbi:RNA polymerase sigma factor [Croceitalea marina]|uniref:RNA polymerase sigma factor n=1 Tax=Croceitalea marina TaxID=1775166 RepID=A0ABW5MSD2_9FLAO
MKASNSLWLLFVEGDEKAFSALFKYYYSMLHNYGSKICGNDILTEDCIQNLFVYLFENKERLSHIKNPNTYLFVSLRNSIFKQLKKRKAEERLAPETEQVISFEFSPEDFLIQKESFLSTTTILNKMLNNLPTREREVIYLKYYSGLSVSEISEVIEISSQSVSNTLLKAMKKLREGALKGVLLSALA